MSEEVELFTNPKVGLFDPKIPNRGSKPCIIYHTEEGQGAVYARESLD